MNKLECEMTAANRLLGGLECFTVSIVKNRTKSYDKVLVIIDLEPFLHMQLRIQQQQ